MDSEMVVHVYGMDNCKFCVAAKEKLRLMGYAYVEHDLEHHTTHHEGWRTDGSIEVLAAYAQYGTAPLLRVDDTVMDYTGAMKALKAMKRERAKAVAVATAS